MRFHTKLITAMAVAGVAFAPASARASALPPGCTVGPTFQLGLGGYLSGCWGNVSVSRLFEFAGDISNVYQFGAATAWDPASFPGTGVASLQPGDAALANAPNNSMSPNFMFNDDCGSPGIPSSPPGNFCAPNGGLKTFNFVWNNNTPILFGLADPSGWVYSGNNQGLNANPAPGALQEVLLRVTGIDANDHFLMGWEDKNTGCISKALTSSSGGLIDAGNNIANGSLTANNLSIVLNACNAANAGGAGDSDFNDFYMMIDASTFGIPTETVPEPMTMTLLATGLAGLGGASFRKRNKKS